MSRPCNGSAETPKATLMLYLPSCSPADTIRIPSHTEHNSYDACRRRADAVAARPRLDLALHTYQDALYTPQTVRAWDACIPNSVCTESGNRSCSRANPSAAHELVFGSWYGQITEVVIFVERLHIYLASPFLCHCRKHASTPRPFRASTGVIHRLMPTHVFVVVQEISPARLRAAKIISLSLPMAGLGIIAYGFLYPDPDPLFHLPRPDQEQQVSSDPDGQQQQITNWSATHEVTPK